MTLLVGDICECTDSHEINSVKGLIRVLHIPIPRPGSVKKTTDMVYVFETYSGHRMYVASYGNKIKYIRKI